MLEEAKKRYSLDEAAAELKIDKSELMEAIKRNRIEVETYTYTIQVISQESMDAYKEFIGCQDNPWGNIDLKFDTFMKPLNLSWFINRFPQKSLTYYAYAVTNDGRVLNVTKKTKCGQTTSTQGYHQVSLRYGDKNISSDVHKLIALMFCPNRRMVEEVHHINGNRKDNRACNLIWLTHKEHITEAHGLLKEARKTNDWTAYNDYIERKQKENEWREHYHLVSTPTPQDPDSRTLFETDHEWFAEMKKDPENVREIFGECYVYDAETDDYVLDTESYFKKFAKTTTSEEDNEEETESEA